jgi:hypothetical protein
MFIVVLCVMTSCSLVDGYQRFWGTYKIHPQFHPEEGGYRFLWNVGNHMQRYTAGWSNFFSSLEPRMLFPLYPRAKKPFQALFLKTNSQFSLYFSEMTYYHSIRSNINFTEMCTNCYRVTYYLKFAQILRSKENKWAFSNQQQINE